MTRIFSMATLTALAACATAGSGDDAPDAAPDAGPRPSLAVIAPNGGEFVHQGNTLTIEWDAQEVQGNVDIELYRGGAKDSNVATTSAEDGSYAWTIPESQANGDDYRIRITAVEDPDTTDLSDADFTIDDRALNLTAPAAGQEILAGDILTITWDTVGVIDTVDIELHRNGALDSVLAQGMANVGTYDWPVETDRVHADDYTIVIRDTATPVSGESEPSFSVHNWATRVPIRVTSGSTRSNFAVAIELDAANFDYARAGPGGSDLRFATTPDRATGFDLPYYIQSWNPSGTSLVWVRVPALGPAAPTDIYMFFELPGITTTSDFDGTFPNRFESTGSDILSGNLVVDVFSVQPGHTITVASGFPAIVNARIVDLQGTIDGNGRGYAGQVGAVGAGPGGGGTSTNAGAGGGGHGGAGGVGGSDANDTPGAGGPANGDASSSTVSMGSAGGGTDAASGGNGGGAVTLRGREVAVSGNIYVNAGNGAGGTSRNGGGGAGGGILLLGYNVSVSGTLSARGGDGGIGIGSANDDGGGGGGGRIKIFAQGILANTANISVAPGNFGTYGDIPGADGVGGVLSLDASATVGEPDITVLPEEPVFAP